MNMKIIIVVLVFIVVDVIVGLAKSLTNGSYKSALMRTGLYHKLGEILAVGFGVLCEYLFPLAGITVGVPIVTSICVYIILMETGSIVENLSIISPALSSLLNRVFNGYKNAEEETEENTTEE